MPPSFSYRRPSIVLLLCVIVCHFLLIYEEANACSQHHLGLLGFSAQPAALETGQTSGLVGSYAYLNRPGSAKQTAHDCAQGLSLGIVSILRYGQVQENSRVWSVSQQEIGSLLGLQTNWGIGKGRLSLSLSGGGQWIRETQDRLQGDRLSQSTTENTEDISLQRSASIWIPEINLAPSIELHLINSPWGPIGLLSRLEFAYHFFITDIPNGITPLTWGIQLGLTMTLALQSSDPFPQITPSVNGTKGDQP